MHKNNIYLFLYGFTVPLFAAENTQCGTVRVMLNKIDEVGIT